MSNAMMRRMGIYAALVAILASVTAGPIQAQAPRQLPLFPSVVFREVATPARYVYLAQAVLEYGPGATSPAGSERSVRFFTVIEGELTLTVAGKTDTYTVGKGASVAPGVIMAGRNGTSSAARVFVSSLVPARGEGAVTAARSPSSSAPRVVYAMRIPVGPLPQVIDVVQGGTRYEPGFVTGPHVMNEIHAILHLTGTTAYEYIGGARETFGPGQAAQMYVGQPGVMANRTASPSTFLITWLVTPGKALTSPWSMESH